jgi:hypothetical protein
MEGTVQISDPHEAFNINLESKIPIDSTMTQQEILFLQDKLRISRFYLEFGSGFSTLEALALVRDQIISVETSAEYIESLTNYITEVGLNRSKVFFHHANIGQTKIWGYPEGDQEIKKWPNYSKVHIDIRPKSFKPDLALIDGRFRVSTFINLYMNYPGLSIIFDDYVDRPQYHVVEEVLAPKETCGRIALFKVPKIRRQSQISLAVGILQDFILIPD